MSPQRTRVNMRRDRSDAFHNIYLAKCLEGLLEPLEQTWCLLEDAGESPADIVEAVMGLVQGYLVARSSGGNDVAVAVAEARLTAAASVARVVAEATGVEDTRWS